MATVRDIYEADIIANTYGFCNMQPSKYEPGDCGVPPNRHILLAYPRNGTCIRIKYTPDELEP